MNYSNIVLLGAIQGGALPQVLRGEMCVYRTPPHINDDMRPTDHAELLEHGIFPLAESLGAETVSYLLQHALIDACTDALGVFCAHQCYYIQVLKEDNGRSPFKLDRAVLPKALAKAFAKHADALHLLALQPADLELDRSYKVVVSGMRVLARDHGIDWGMHFQG